MGDTEGEPSPEEVERRAVRGGDVSDEEWERQLRQVHPNYVRARRFNRSRLFGLGLILLVFAGVMVGQGRSTLLAIGIVAAGAAFIGLSIWLLRRSDEI